MSLHDPRMAKTKRGLDFLSLSQTQRRYAHEYRRWALEMEAAGNLKRYHDYRAESDRLWRDAKRNIYLARCWIYHV